MNENVRVATCSRENNSNSEERIDEGKERWKNANKYSMIKYAESTAIIPSSELYY